MSRDEMPVDGTPLLAPGSQPCIWMSAGLVSYRLCDRDFDCDCCPFDAAMRGIAGARRDEALPLADPGERAVDVFPADRGYHPSHLWAQVVSRNRVRCGVDAFVARALSAATAVALPALRRRLRRGRVALWVHEGTAAFPLRAPVSGTVAQTNRDLEAHPALFADDPYGAGWLYELTCPAAAERVESLSAADEQLRRSLAQSAELARLGAPPLALDPAVGPTLPDGGLPHPGLPGGPERPGWLYLRRALGAEAYHRLIRRYLD